LQVTVTTTGPNAPPIYPLLLCQGFWIRCAIHWAVERAEGGQPTSVAELPATGEVFLKVPSDSITVGLPIPSGCSAGRTTSINNNLTSIWTGIIAPADTGKAQFHVDCP
jgi:hypothetical protein